VFTKILKDCWRGIFSTGRQYFLAAIQQYKSTHGIVIIIIIIIFFFFFFFFFFDIIILIKISESLALQLTFYREHYHSRDKTAKRSTFPAVLRASLPTRCIVKYTTDQNVIKLCSVVYITARFYYTQLDI